MLCFYIKNYIFFSKIALRNQLFEQFHRIFTAQQNLGVSGVIDTTQPPLVSGVIDTTQPPLVSGVIDTTQPPLVSGVIDITQPPLVSGVNDTGKFLHKFCIVESAVSLTTARLGQRRH
jgi:hypothetical protein